MFSSQSTRVLRSTARIFALLLCVLALAAPVFAQEHHGGEANLVLPDLNQATFLGGIGGRNLLMGGLVGEESAQVTSPSVPTVTSHVLPPAQSTDARVAASTVPAAS